MWVSQVCTTIVEVSDWTLTDKFPDDNPAQWRLSLGLQMLPAVFLAALIFLFPESPRWLIDHGRTQEGLKTLARLHAHGNEQDPWVLAEFEQIQESIAFEHDHEAKVSKLSSISNCVNVHC